MLNAVVDSAGTFLVVDTGVVVDNKELVDCVVNVVAKSVVEVMIGLADVDFGLCTVVVVVEVVTTVLYEKNIFLVKNEIL